MAVHACHVEPEFHGRQAGELLQAGREKYDRGDRMGAVNMFEKVLKQVLGTGPVRGT